MAHKRMRIVLKADKVMLEEQRAEEVLEETPPSEEVRQLEEPQLSKEFLPLEDSRISEETKDVPRN